MFSYFQVKPVGKLFYGQQKWRVGPLNTNKWKTTQHVWMWETFLIEMRLLKGEINGVFIQIQYNFLPPHQTSEEFYILRRFRTFKLMENVNKVLIMRQSKNETKPHSLCLNHSGPKLVQTPVLGSSLHALSIHIDQAFQVALLKRNSQ